MLRRNARLRKEFLYRKSLEGKERELYEKKRKIREALEGISKTLCVILLIIRLGQVSLANGRSLLLLIESSSSTLCMKEGKPIPTDLQKEEQALRHEVELEDDNTAG